MGKNDNTGKNNDTGEIDNIEEIDDTREIDDIDEIDNIDEIKEDESKKQLAVNERQRIINLRQRGYKIKDICNIYEISIRTVKRIIEKDKKLHTLERKTGTGTNKKYNENKVKKKININD